MSHILAFRTSGLMIFAAASRTPVIVMVLCRSLNIIIHRFYTALFSALEQTHCAHVACDSERATVSFL